MTHSQPSDSGRLRILLLVIVAALAMVLASCGGPLGPPQPTGPLVFMNIGEVTVGMDAPRNGRFPSLGTLLVTNTDSRYEATLSEIRLGGGSHLSVEAAYVVPLVDGTKFGGGFLVPPGAEGFPRPSMNEQWAARRDMSGYRVPPGQDANLLVVVNVDNAEGGMSQWLELDYSINQRHYLAVANTNICVSREENTATCVP